MAVKIILDLSHTTFTNALLNEERVSQSALKLWIDPQAPETQAPPSSPLLVVSLLHTTGCMNSSPVRVRIGRHTFNPIPSTIDVINSTSVPSSS